jgi:hypothetical protein
MLLARRSPNIVGSKDLFELGGEQEFVQKTVISFFPHSFLVGRRPSNYLLLMRFVCERQGDVNVADDERLKSSTSVAKARSIKCWDPVDGEVTDQMTMLGVHISEP